MLKITITQEFEKFSDAQRFLDAFSGARPGQQIRVEVPAVKPVLNIEEPLESAPSAAPVEKKPRKPRADAGKPRGAYKTGGTGGSPAGDVRTAPDAPKAPGAPAPVPPASVAAPTSAPNETPELTIEFLRARMKELSDMKGKGIDATLAALQKFGKLRVSDLPPEKYAEFNAYLGEQMVTK